jgi:hypothetical protein
MRLVRSELVAFAVLLAGTGLARATDTLIGSVYGTHFAGDYYALGGSFAWQRTFTDGGFVIGFGNTGFPLGTLSEGDVDVYRTLPGSVTINGGVSLGEATTAVRSNTLYKARMSIDAALDSTWTIHAGYQYVDLYLIHGDLLAAGAECRLTQTWTLKAAGGLDAHGTVGARYGSVELGWLQRQRLYAGVVVGRTGYDPAHLGEVTFEERLFQIYVGGAIPVHTATLTIALDTLSLGGAARQTLRIGLAQPIS